jgi:hypothetical protein
MAQSSFGAFAGKRKSIKLLMGALSDDVPLIL